METNEISWHEVQVWRAVVAMGDKWFSNTELGETIPNVNGRTVRIKTKKLADLGVLDVAEVFPAHRFRRAKKAARSMPYVRRLEDATEVFREYDATQPEKKRHGK